MSRKNWKEKERLEELCRFSIEKLPTSELLRLETFLSNLLAYKKLDKLDTTFVKGPKRVIENFGPKAHCDFNIDGTVTGRLSCSTYYGNNRQPMGVSFHTLPNKDKKLDVNIRNIYSVDKPNQRFITADYSTMELRVLAHLADVREMKHAFNTGLDLHSHTASLIFEKNIEDVQPDERSQAKTANFLIVYGGGASNLSEVVGITIKRAQHVIDRHKEVYHEVHRLMAETEEKVRHFKYVENPFGRRRHLPDIDSPDGGMQHRVLRQAFNMVIQSTASDILLCADASLMNEIKYRNYEDKVRIAANVHDSMEVICDEEVSETVCHMVINAMKINPVAKKLIGDFSVPFEVELEVGNTFGDGIPMEEYFDQD